MGGSFYVLASSSSSISTFLATGLSPSVPSGVSVAKPLVPEF